MEDKTINIENIIKPYKAFNENKQNLISNLVIDYDTKLKDKISERINNAVFIFDSKPMDTKKFVADNLNKIKDNRIILRSEIEYRDYIREEKKIQKQMEKLFANYIKEYVYIDSITNLEKLYNLDFEAYSFENNALLARQDTNERIKKDIEKRRNEFKINCIEIPCELSFDPETIEKIIRHKRSIEIFKKVELINNTRWGKRIKRQIKNNFNFNITSLQLAYILFEKECASTDIIKDENGNNKTICYIPLIENINSSSLDRILFHELRHVSEMTDTTSGISTFYKRKYDTLNEIRTEKNAIIDENRLNKTIFSSNKRYTNSLYERLFKYTDNFFEDNKYILDEIALRGDIELLEKSLIRLSALCLVLHSRQSVNGSANESTCPEAFQTFGCISISASSSYALGLS